MKDEYDPAFDSPEAKANFATRHIFNPQERKQRRDELVREYRSAKVVEMFPGRKAAHFEKSRIVLSFRHANRIQSLDISRSDWTQIKAGAAKTITGTGFLAQDGVEQDFWRFNHPEDGDLHIFCSSGRELFSGRIAELMATESSREC
jgi:hypothetical protein